MSSAPTRDHPSELSPAWEPLQAEKQEPNGAPILQMGSLMLREAGSGPRVSE